MAIQNDDWDIRKAWLYTEAGGNGDYYVTIATEGEEELVEHHSIRVTTSGSRYPPEVMLAVANLHRTLEMYGLDGRELNQELEFKRHIEPKHSITNKMSTTMGDIKCTLTDEQLIEACNKWVSMFCESGGRAWTLQVPVNMNEDPDILLTELVNRFKKHLSFQLVMPSIPETVTMASKYARQSTSAFNVGVECIKAIYLDACTQMREKIESAHFGVTLSRQIDWEKLKADWSKDHAATFSAVNFHYVFDWFKQQIG